MKLFQSSPGLFVVAILDSCLAIGVLAGVASFVPLPAWLTPSFGPDGDILAGDIYCYGLPYGGIGNVSHILTYWALGCIYFYRRPWMPWSELAYSKLDIFLGFTQLIGCVLLAFLTILRCRLQWQLIALAVGRMTNSWTMGWCTIAVSVRVYRDDDWAKVRSLPYLVHLAAIPTLVGLIGLVQEAWAPCASGNDDMYYLCQTWPANWGLGQPMPQITGSFLGVIGLLFLVLLVCLLRRYCPDRDSPSGSTMHAIGIAVTLAFYLWSDWILAAIADDLAGEPSSDVAIVYWVSIFDTT